MKKLILKLPEVSKSLLLILIFLKVSILNSQPSLVIGGEPIDKSVAPYQVSFEYNNSHRCGGVILNEE